MTGRLADFFLFWWALAYWNTRKTWFRLHGAHRDFCPCQASSDSGHAQDSRCAAVAQGKEPQRFRKVCPLLTEIPRRLPEDEAGFLRQRAFQARGPASLADAETEFDVLMRLPMTPRLATLCSAFLLEWPDRAQAVRYLDRFLEAAPQIGQFMSQIALPVEALYALLARRAAAKR